MKAARRPRPHFFVSILLLGVLGMMLFSFLVIKPVHATTPFISHTGVATCALCGAKAVTVTIDNLGDTVVIAFQWITNSPNTNTFITSIAGASTTFTSQNGATYIYLNSGGNNYYSGTEIWSGSAGATGAQGITVSWSNTPNTVGLEGYDLIGTLTNAVATDTGACAVGANCPASIKTNHNNAFTAGASLEIGSIGSSDGLGAAGTGYTALNSGAINMGGIYSTTASSVGSPTNFPSSTSGGCGNACNWGVTGAIFGSTSGTSATTTVINTMCLGSCGTQTTNGTTIFSIVMPNLYIFQTSQNVGTPGSIDNFTMKIGSVHINTNTGTVYVLVCETANSNPPNAGNPFNCFTPYSYPVFNNTSNVVLQVNPQNLICAGCYYTAGIMPITTASRGSGASGAGVSFYETSAPVQQFKYAVGASIPPTKFFSNTVLTPNLYMFVHLIFPVGTVTSTITSTFTGTNVVTSTLSTTVTSTTLDAVQAATLATADAVDLLVILLPAMIIMVPIAIYTKSASGAGIGFVAGLMIGSGIGVQAGLVPPVFLGLTVIVGIFMIVGLSRSAFG